jgi:aryl-alcohol dehydrogenase-like predicted oxidoreductase
MQTRKLGFSELHLTAVGLGTWAIGGPWLYGWGPQDDSDSLAAIRRALELGINWIDTAAIYGVGHAEEMLGRAIAGRRDEVIVATKCGRLWDDDADELKSSLKADSIRREVEGSLRRLKVEVIDLYQIHWPDPDEDIEEGWSTIAELIHEGKVRYGGVSNFSLAQLKRLQPIHPVASLQPPYNMLQREVEDELLAYCAANRIGVIAYGPMSAGLLTGKLTRQRIADLPQGDWRRRDTKFNEPQVSANLRLVEGLRPIAERKGISLAQLAIAWVLRRPEVTAAIVGARRPDQIEETAAAGDMSLSEAEIAEIEALLAEREAAPDMKS